MTDAASTRNPAPPIARWSALASLAIVIPAPSIGALASFWLFPGPIGLVTYAVCKAVLYLTPALWSRFVDGEPWSWSPPRKGGFGIGIGLGLLIGALIWAVYLVLGERAIDVSIFREVLDKNGLSTPMRFLVAAAWLSFVNALLEEYVFRWFITTRFAAVAPRAAIGLSAAAFTLHHVIVLLKYLPVPSTILASAGIFVGGLLWSWLYRRSDSVWPPYVSHAIVDLAVMGVGYWALM
ncbi:MAG: CPBP family intramembrane metalloprotease [Phycisphaerae bacterium]|nr:CPBP family intramembrane metalloprotease [Phycisphaerae bacterium]